MGGFWVWIEVEIFLKRPQLWQWVLRWSWQEEVMYGLRVPIRRQRGHLFRHLQNQLREQLTGMRRMWTKPSHSTRWLSKRPTWSIRLTACSSILPTHRSRVPTMASASSRSSRLPTFASTMSTMPSRLLTTGARFNWESMVSWWASRRCWRSIRRTSWRSTSSTIRESVMARV